MKRSSESIAQLACALAKAQMKLANPKKTLEATIYPDGTGEEGRSFNYASLASGLDIVRKTLGQHEIAIVQTTAIDRDARIVNLTTVLAHSSGEWIASDWPVCALSETATPHRMGMALTYARRYGLFALVGITGEDDLDAPDLQSPRRHSAGSPQTNHSQNGHRNGGRGSPHRPGKGRSFALALVLSAEQSAALRDRLLAELGDLGSADEAAIWAHRRIGEKNKLCGEDAQRIEEVFAQKLAAYAPPESEIVEPAQQQAPVDPSTPSREGAPLPEEPAAMPAARPEPQHAQLTKRPRSTGAGATKGERGRRIGKRPPSSAKRPSPAKVQLASNGIDKSVLALSEPRRIRNREHVRYVAQQPCLVCGRKPCDPHHLRFAQGRALGRKVSDEFTVPLCRGHHREVHRHGDEATWWKKLKIDPAPAARTLWLTTHPLPFGRKKENDESLEPPSRRDRRPPMNGRSVGANRPKDGTKPLAGAP